MMAQSITHNTALFIYSAFWAYYACNWKNNKFMTLMCKPELGSKQGSTSTRWEGSIYSHVFVHNQLSLAAYLLLQDPYCLVCMEVALAHRCQFCAEEVWRFPRRPDDLHSILVNIEHGYCAKKIRVRSTIWFTFNSSLRTKCCWSPFILSIKFTFINKKIE